MLLSQEGSRWGPDAVLLYVRAALCCAALVLTRYVFEFRSFWGVVRVCDSVIDGQKLEIIRVRGTLGLLGCREKSVGVPVLSPGLGFWSPSPSYYRCRHDAIDEFLSGPSHAQERFVFYLRSRLLKKWWIFFSNFFLIFFILYVGVKRQPHDIALQL